MATDSEDLAEARRAWQARREAASKLDHLKKYSRLTAGMKDEKRIALTKFDNADQTLRRILGGER